VPNGFTGVRVRATVLAPQFSRSSIPCQEGRMSAMGHAAFLARRSAARSTFALGFTLLAAAAPIAAAQNGTVLGTVTVRGTNQPVDAARAQVVGTTIAGASDSRGAFVLRGVRAGP
jgi:hypothetical protein